MLGRDTELAGKLADNILYFGRVLRAAGLPVGPGKVIEAIRAAEAVGLRNKDDFYWGLHSVFVNRQDQHEVFNQAFHIVWRKPNILAQVLGTEMPGMAPPEDAEQVNRRVSEAVNKERGNEGEDNREKEQEIELDASFTYSNQEVLPEDRFRNHVDRRNGASEGNHLAHAATDYGRPDQTLCQRSTRPADRYAAKFSGRFAIWRIVDSPTPPGTAGAPAAAGCVV